MADIEDNRRGNALGDFLVAQSLAMDWKLILNIGTYDALESCCRALECAMETITLPFLTIVAAHMGNCRCKVNSDWLEQLKMWCIVVARKGEKKSTVCDKMRAAIRHKASEDSNNLQTTGSFDKETVKIYDLTDSDKNESSRPMLQHDSQRSITIVDNLEYHLTKSQHNLRSLFPLDNQELKSGIKKAHDEPLAEYVLSMDGAEEFFRVRKSLHVLRQHYTEDEVRRGCINHTFGHVICTAAVLQALSNRENKEDGDDWRTIGSNCIQRAFLLVLQLLRHKFAIIGDSYGCMDFVELLTSKEIHRLKMNLYNTDPLDQDMTANDDVIEIRMGERNEPVARILSNGKTLQRNPSDLIIHDVNESSSSDVDILRQGYTQSFSNQTAPSDTVLLIKDEQKIPTKLHQDTEGNLSQEKRDIVKPGSSNQPIFPDRHMVSHTGQKSLDHPPPLLKIRNNHVLQNKHKSVPPKRIIERPRVPLVQRTSSPRTTHPSWAAIKFFERLEKLGLGEVLVFRSQSIRFQKKSYDEMSEETRVLLRSVGVEEEAYREAFNRTDDMALRMRQGDRAYFAKEQHDGACYQVQEIYTVYN
ncbi:hypothetical protein FSP39_022370 [Pinctada imbricata]|uniref:Uncharacterized protein n=1 Tax=Pinctada imbricata TaxID=66713 RepID=A0AA89BWC1_PINIB|nr:hypothetical protein FSP39_022370 [Pinctada imbricata]